MRPPLRLHRRLVLLFLLGLPGMGLGRGVCNAEPGDPPPPAILDLPRGGYLEGGLLDAPGEEGRPRTTVVWQSPAFVRSFEFALDAVAGVRFPQPSASLHPKPADAWRIDLASGDHIIGGLESIDEQRIVVTTGADPAATRLTVRRDAVIGMFRDEGGAEHATPVGLLGWRQVPADTWRDEARRLTNVSSPTRLQRDFPVAARASYDMTLSWRERPTLRIGFGGGLTPDAAWPYRLELGPGGMVAVRDEPGAGATEGRADLQPFGELPEQTLQVTVFVDQQAGRLAVMVAGAREPVADISIVPSGETSGSGLLLAVVDGEVTFGDLRVLPWKGGDLGGDARRQGTLRLRDGEVLAAVVREMRPDSGSLQTRPAAGAGAGVPEQIALESVEEIVLPSAATAVPGPVPSGVQATDLWGGRLTGKLLRVEQDTLWLSHPAIDEAVPLPMGALVTLGTTVRPAVEAELPGRRGRLTCAASSVWGCLVSGDGDDERAAVAWLPAGSLNASPLAFPSDGTQPRAMITYVESPHAAPATDELFSVGGIGGHVGAANGRPTVVALIAGSAAQAAGVKPGDMILALSPRGDGCFVDTGGMSLEDAQLLLRGRVGSRLQLRLRRSGEDDSREIALVRRPLAQFGRNAQALEQALEAHDRFSPPETPSDEQRDRDPYGSLLILRSGETLRCLVESIGERGVTIRQPVGDPVMVAVDRVLAVELVPARGRTVTAEKFRSLTTLPRSQRQQPPTHVLRSLQGDYLRGRLVSVDARTVRIHVEADSRGEPLALPRGDVARVIWLHPEALHEPWNPPPPAASAGLLVESLTGENGRLAMTATGIEGNFLRGENPLVGPCCVDISGVDRLLIGGVAAGRPRQLPYSQWKLQPASEPRNLRRPSSATAEPR